MMEFVTFAQSILADLGWRTDQANSALVVIGGLFVGLLLLRFVLRFAIGFVLFRARTLFWLWSCGL